MPEEWDIEENTPNGDYVLHKEFVSGADVFIAVNKITDGYEVRTQAATESEVEPDEVKEPIKTLDEAKALAHATAKKWDDDHGKPEK